MRELPLDNRLCPPHHRMAMSDSREALARIPPIDRLVRSAIFAPLVERYPRPQVVAAARAVTGALREDPAGVSGDADALAALLAEQAEVWLMRKFAPSLIRVINATGVIVHTGLGRSPLAAEAREAISRVAGYAALEVDPQRGGRGSRLVHVEGLLRELTGAEAALVVNNNAAAVLLALGTLAAGREAVVSRGQLIEIGGAFRMPDIMSRAGSRMVEVGTTNRTHTRDYESALGSETGCVVVVHASNYKVLGFTMDVPLREVARIAHAEGVPVLHDLGGGALVDLRQYGLPYEPVVRESLHDGADVVTFSGDKVLGGPQAGIVVGRGDLIAEMRWNPLMRALRCDKLTLAALEATLKLFLDPERLPESHPVLRMLVEPLDAVRARVERTRSLAVEAGAGRGSLEIVEAPAEMGSGALPLEVIPSAALVVRDPSLRPQELARRLRLGAPPVYVYVTDDAVHCNLRTVGDDEVPDLARALAAALNAAEG